MGLSENVTALASRISTEFKSVREAMVAKTVMDAKGDLIVGAANDTIQRLAIGATPGQVLTVDPASSVGISWQVPTGEGGVASNMVTTDTDQMITGGKTWSDGEGNATQVASSGIAFTSATGNTFQVGPFGISGQQIITGDLYHFPLGQATSTRVYSAYNPPPTPTNMVTADTYQEIDGYKTFVNGLSSGDGVESYTSNKTSASPPSTYPMGMSTVSLTGAQAESGLWPHASAIGGMVTTWRSSDTAFQHGVIGGYAKFRQKNGGADTWGNWVTLLDGSPWSNKGSLAVGSNVPSEPAPLVVGANGTVLTADSTAVTGLAWKPPPAPANMVTTTNVYQEIAGTKSFESIEAGDLSVTNAVTAGQIFGVGVYDKNLPENPPSRVYSAINPPPAPSNMVTTDTDQAITGFKTFGQVDAEVVSTTNVQIAQSGALSGSLVSLEGGGVYATTPDATVASPARTFEVRATPSYWNGSAAVRATSNARLIASAPNNATRWESNVPILAPNLVTTDTTQNITGTKQFETLHSTLPNPESLSNNQYGGGSVLITGQYRDSGGVLGGKTGAKLEPNSPASGPGLHIVEEGGGYEDIATLRFGYNRFWGTINEVSDGRDYRVYSALNPPPARANMVTTDTDQTISGTKTFSAAPTVPDSSFSVAKLSATGTRDATTVLRGDGTWAVPATPPPPSNMVTTNTAQTITGAKTLNAILDTDSFSGGEIRENGARVFSPSNRVPPSGINATGTRDTTTFLRGDGTWVAPVAATPANMMTTDTSQSVTAPKTYNAGTLFIKDASGVVTEITPGGGGPTIALNQDYTDATPAVPGQGAVIFARYRARRLLATVGPSGQDTAYQPALFSNRISRWSAINNTVPPTLDSMAVTNIAAPTAIANSGGSGFYGTLVRSRFTSSATAGTGAGMRTTSAQWFFHQTATGTPRGGFFYVCRFGISALTATHRGFFGLSSSTAALSPTVNPSTLTNMVGFGWDSGQTTMRLFTNPATAQTATHVDLGANFPVNTTLTDFYEIRLFNPSGSGPNLRWSIQRLNDGALAQGVVTTALPSIGTTLAAHCHHSNGTTAAAVSFELQSLYVESDN